jgi:phosphoglycerate dehydrogenase-like enzyme
MSPERAEDIGVCKVSLEVAFRDAYVVSNHLRDTTDTRGLLTGELFASMRPGATFINTGRGRTVATDELVSVLRDRPDLIALLDVTEPEPLPPGHALWTLPNVYLSSHIAGSVGDEVLRLADCAIEEFGRFLKGEELLYRVFE